MRPIIAILQYPHYPLPAVIKSYLTEGVEVVRWNVCREKKYDFPSKGWLMRIWALTFFRWLPKIGRLRNKTIFATAAHFPLLAIARLFGFLMGGYRIYLDNLYLHALGQNRAVRRVLSFLIANPRVTIFTYAPNEAEYFRKLSAVPKVHFIPFCSDFSPITGDFPPSLPLDERKGYIFTGGYSNRDYPLILRLAERFPAERFVVVASGLNRLGEKRDLPPNVTLFTDLPTAQFESLLAASKIVVIPLKEDVGSSGQMLAISALRNSKPTIFTDLPVISYFFADGAGIPYRMGDGDSLAKALQSVTGEPELRRKLSEAAKETSRSFTIEHQVELFRKYIRI